MNILIPILVLSGIGFGFGLILAIAAKKFKVNIDPRLDEINTLLPGSNCGACGKAGCFGFAESLFSEGANPSACKVCSQETQNKISELLGKATTEKVKLVARLHCNGGDKVKDRSLYNQAKDCISANITLGGQKACAYGCLGFGDCAMVCHFNAITMADNGLPVVNEEKCTSCNKCVEICPKNLFTLIAQKSSVYVACLSRDSIKDTKTACPVGCVGCKLCERVCKFDAIHVIDNIALIDYAKCTSCGDCVRVCPSKCIIMKSANSK